MGKGSRIETEMREVRQCIDCIHHGLLFSEFPCNECAKAIIQAGIKTLVYESDKYADTPATIASKRMMEAAGVNYRQYRRTGREIKFTI